MRVLFKRMHYQLNVLEPCLRATEISLYMNQRNLNVTIIRLLYDETILERHGVDSDCSLSLICHTHIT
jgi:hypothetical protein